jgi:3-hydroxyisobutyrate dehydrogenase-like beta-hydroxyacid dehydrogenase
VSREVIPAARPGTVLVDMSTVSPAASARVASLAEAASVAYLRAPVSGNPSVVRAGNLSFIVSGPRATLDRVEPVLRAIGPTVHHVGEEEQARVVKLAINLMIAGLAQLMSEALVLGEAAGVSRASLLEVMSTSAVGAPFVKYKTEPLLRDDFSATFTTALMDKDIELVLDAAEEAGVELPVATEMKTLLRAAIEAGYSDNDFMALFLHLRSAAPLTRVGDHPDQEVVR